MVEFAPALAHGVQRVICGDDDSDGMASEDDSGGSSPSRSM